MTAGYSAAQVRTAEVPLLAAGEPLMLRAAAGLEAAVARLVAAPARILLIVGSGDNGGDALFAGAGLARRGNTVSILATGDRMHEAALTAALAAGAHVVDHPVESDVVVDGILGTGTSSDPALRGRAREIVDALLGTARRENAPLVVAVDLPSGIHPDTGEVNGPVLPADVTVTFGAIKAGLLLEPAKSLAGRIELIDLGLDLSEVEPLVRL
jgi:NAD(P)H-hydrate epimerase